MEVIKSPGYNGFWEIEARPVYGYIHRVIRFKYWVIPYYSYKVNGADYSRSPTAYVDTEVKTLDEAKSILIQLAGESKLSC